MAIIIRAIQEGCANKFEWVLMRTIGKVESKITITPNDNPYHNMSLDELIAKKKELDSLNGKTIRKIEGIKPDIEVLPEVKG